MGIYTSCEFCYWSFQSGNFIFPSLLLFHYDFFLTYRSVFKSSCIFESLSVCPSVCLSLCPRFSLCLSVCLSVSLSLCLSLSLFQFVKKVSWTRISLQDINLSVSSLRCICKTARPFLSNILSTTLSCYCVLNCKLVLYLSSLK